MVDVLVVVCFYEDVYAVGWTTTTRESGDDVPEKNASRDRPNIGK